MTRSLDDMILEVRPVAKPLGLRGPAVEQDNMCFRLAYFGKEIGLEILTEFESFFAFALPFRMLDGDTFTDSFTGPDGMVSAMYLQLALDRLHIPYDVEHRELKRLGGDYRNCKAMTTILAARLERTWGSIEKNADMLFPVVG